MAKRTTQDHQQRPQYVAYYRVSTQRQGQSGLGLEAQQEASSQFLKATGGHLLAEYTEVETGKGSNAMEKRPELRKAIRAAQRGKAVLLIAKLDRLARNIHFISGLMESKVRFVCADMPEANELTINILAAVAQHEAKMISQRTREALQRAKARGVKLGNPNLHIDNTKRIEAADAWAESVRGVITGLVDRGLTQRAVVEELNKAGVRTSRGCEWKLATLQRVMKRLDIQTNRHRQRRNAA